MSTEAYNVYVCNSTDGSVISPHTTWVILFGLKDDTKTLEWGVELKNASEQIGTDADFKFTYSDIVVDRRLFTGMGIKLMP